MWVAAAPFNSYVMDTLMKSAIDGLSAPEKAVTGAEGDLQVQLDLYMGSGGDQVNLSEGKKMIGQ